MQSLEFVLNHWLTRSFDGYSPCGKFAGKRSGWVAVRFTSGRNLAITNRAGETKSSDIVNGKRMGTVVAED